MSVKPRPQTIETVYLVLTLFNTLAASFIWGINTLFLLDAGLNNAQAFLANAFFTVGQVMFEVPTGVVADMRGRRLSYLLGTVTLAISTLLYLGAWQMHASLWLWAVSSILLGLGFTFFSGATEAWLVDALEHTGHEGDLETVFGRGQMVSGAAMLVGSVSGGLIAQATNLGVPYMLRIIFLLITFAVAWRYMQDWGFEPDKTTNVVADIRALFKKSFRIGLKAPEIRWIMLAAPFTTGVSFYAFYAMQPHLLNLYNDPTAYGVAGLAAAIVAGARVIGGMTVARVRRWFKLRTSALLTMSFIGTAALVAIGFTSNFWLAIVLLSLWGLTFSAAGPIRQTYLNKLIPSRQRATVLSFDSLMGSSGGAVIQPALGKVADVWHYPASFVVGGAFQSIALPLIYLARKEKPKADKIG